MTDYEMFEKSLAPEEKRVVEYNHRIEALKRGWME